MPDTPKKILVFFVFLYTVSIFGSQAMMSIGYGLCAMALAWAAWRSPDYRASLARVWQSAAGRRYWKATLFLVFALFASLVGARLAPVDIGGMKPEVRWLPDLAKCMYFVWPIPLAAAFLTLPSAGFARVQRVWLVAFAVVSGFGFLELVTGFNPRDVLGKLPHATFGGLSTVNWLFGSYLTYASVMSFPFFFALESWVESERVRRGLAAFAVAAGGVALFGTMSRTLWVALPVGVLVYFLLRLRGRQLATVLVGMGLLVAVTFQLPAVKSRLHYGRGISQRTNLWKINFEFFKMRPLTGVGWHKNQPLSAAYFETYLPDEPEKFVGHAHSNIFEFLGGMGLLGLVAWIGWSWVTAGLAFSFSPALLCAWLVFHLNGLTQVNFSESKTLHTAVWVVALSLAGVLRKAGPSRDNAT